MCVLSEVRRVSYVCQIDLENPFYNCGITGLLEFGPEYVYTPIVKDICRFWR